MEEQNTFFEIFILNLLFLRLQARVKKIGTF